MLVAVDSSLIFTQMLRRYTGRDKRARRGVTGCKIVTCALSVFTSDRLTIRACVCLPSSDFLRKADFFPAASCGAADAFLDVSDVTDAWLLHDGAQAAITALRATLRNE